MCEMCVLSTFMSSICVLISENVASQLFIEKTHSPRCSVLTRDAHSADPEFRPSHFLKQNTPHKNGIGQALLSIYGAENSNYRCR